MLFDIEKAKKAQNTLSRLAVIEPFDTTSVDVVVGLDVSYHDSNAIAAAVAYSVNRREVIATELAIKAVKIPYIPGLLAFREAPVMLLALKMLLAKLRKIDVIMVNGHGLAHPRRCGIATHIGVVTDMPTIGIAKKLLYGEVVLIDNHLAIVVDNSIVGYVVNRKKHRIYVSIGHRITAEDALRMTLIVWNENSPLPEPIKLADKISRDYKRAIFNSK
ncbi:MAG: endonuclease V [Ignisphaera sp.]